MLGREISHGHHRSPDDACAGGEKHTYHHDRNTEPPAHTAHQPRHTVEQFLRHAGFFQDSAHQDKQGHSDEGGVVDRTVDATWQCRQKTDIEHAGQNTTGGKCQRRTSKSQCHRITEH
jgi:hypothetical protein